MSDSKVVLGIDPGIRSIGWALIKENSKGEFSEFIDSGSVIFKPVFEPQYFKLLGTTRTDKRQVRRQRDRKKRRLSKLENFLIKSKILSASIEQLESDGCDIQSLLGNPYYLRSKALDHPLSGDELSYIILHLFRRRGFKSSLKSKTDKEKKADALTSDVMNNMREAGCRTLGEYFYKLNNGKDKKIKIRNSDLKTEEEVNLTGSKLLRDNLNDELEMILEEQSNHNNHLTDIVKQEILFQFNFQRPLKAQKKRVFCPLERKTYFDKELNKKINKGLPCANKLTAYAQKFIILQTINNIKVTTRDDDPENNHTLPLTVKQKSILFDALWKSKEIKFSSVRKKLQLSESTLINFEFGEKLSLKGNQLYAYFKGNVAKRMKAMNYEELNDLLTDIHMNKGAEHIGLFP